MGETSKTEAISMEKKHPDSKIRDNKEKKQFSIPQTKSSSW